MAIITTSINCIVSDTCFEPMLVNDMRISTEYRSGRLPIFVAAVQVPVGPTRRAALTSKFVHQLLECMSTPEHVVVEMAHTHPVYIRLIKRETP